MTNRKSKSPTTPVAPPESLIIGNGVAARACLEWIQEIDRTLRELGRALQPALGAEAVGETARNILMIRLHNAAVEHASSLTRLQQRHQEVVTNAVWAWVGPVIDEARDACRDIMDIAERRAVSPEELKPVLVRLKTPAGELRRLQQLLCVERPAAIAVAAPAAIPDQVSISGRACALLLDHRDWSVRVIARTLGTSRSTLYRNTTFMAAWKARKAGLPKGKKTAAGEVEAWEDD